MKTHELIESVKSLYGGFESVDLIAAVEDGVVNAEEQAELATIIREENYRRLLAGSADRYRRNALVRFDARRKAMSESVPAGMILRGSTWVKLSV